MSAVLVAGAFGKDYELAAEENAFFIVPAAITAAKISAEIVSLLYEEEIEATKEEICHIVADKVGCSPQAVSTVYELVMAAVSTRQALKHGSSALKRKITKHVAQHAVKSPTFQKLANADAQKPKQGKGNGKGKAEASGHTGVDQDKLDPRNRAQFEKYRKDLEAKNQPYKANSLNPNGTEKKYGRGFPDRKLPRDQYGDPKPDSTYPHTQLGTKEGSKGPYPQAREFAEGGQPVRDIDFTNHGKPQVHPNPHVHNYLPSKTGGTAERERVARPLIIKKDQ